MRTENIYSVYVHKNLKNDKYYVGTTSQEPKKRWDSGWGYKSQPKMWKDIQESDWNKDWLHGILGKFTDKNEALKYEAFLIAMLDSVKNGYNTSSFDNSFYKKTEEHRKKISESMTGRTLSEEHRKKLSEAMTGRVLTDEHRKKLSESMKGKICGEVRLRPVLQFSKSGELIAEYSSISEAERCFGCNHICDCCMGKRKSCGGYLWKYKNGGLN